MDLKMDFKDGNNQGEKQADKSVEKKDHLAATAMIVMLAVIIAYAGYEYFWRSLKMSELVNQETENVATTTLPKQEVGGEKIAAEPVAPAAEAAEPKPAAPVELIAAGNSAPAVLKITDQGKTYTIGLVIDSDCQSPATGDSVDTARKTAKLTGLTVNGNLTPIKFDQKLVCTYPAGVKEAYVPDPRLAVTSVDQAGKKVFFSVSTSENQGSGRETVWRNNFFFDLTTGTIK
jgi:hypothetical protein